MPKKHVFTEQEILEQRILNLQKILTDQSKRKFSPNEKQFLTELSQHLSQVQKNLTQDLDTSAKILINTSKLLNAKFAEFDKNAEYSRRFKNVVTDFYNELTTIKQIEHAEFKAPKETQTKAEITWHPINRICFRGDDRPPEEIFKKGFTAQETGDLMISKPFESTKKAVPFSSRFSAAAVFPIDEDVETTWVYLFYATKGYNVQQHGYSALVEQGLTEESASGLFVNELITDEIKPETIIGAVKVNRYELDRFLDAKNFPAYIDKSNPTEEDKILIDFFKKRGKFSLKEFHLNENCNLSSDIKKTAEWYVSKEMEANKNEAKAQILPMPSSGYHKQRTKQPTKTKAAEIEADKTHAVKKSK